MANYLKLHRKMLEWGWYSDINTRILFFHCLLKTNWKSGEWQGIHYEAGEFITSLETLANETGLTISQIRTALKHLTLTGEITSKSQGKARVITVNNWCQYQDDSKEDSREMTRSSQDDSKGVATDIDIKKIRSKDNNNIHPINIYPSSFNEFWDNYPRKQDKGQAFKCYQARLNDGYTEDQLLTACKNYAAECQKEKRERKYIKVASTFLSVNEPFIDYLNTKEGGSDSNNDDMARRIREDAEKRNAELDEHIKRIEAGEFDDEDAELRAIFGYE